MPPQNLQVVIEEVPGTFGQCLVKQLARSSDDVCWSSVEQHGDKVVIAKDQCGSPSAVPLTHAPACPVREYRGAIKNQKEKQIRTGVVVVVECDNKVLITRRGPQMRSYPSCWVFPGGHVDDGESLEEGAVRELLEEVGIDVLPHLSHPLSEAQGGQGDQEGQGRQW
eukprot:Rmarinus@m.27837